uniref:Glycosyl hydrolase family 13 catalytic domain-containing protein n=1 Tax=uncultured prokaryote TaxID=198431 RepID=A0A0H5Q2F9_9ZZZZ|nr:hypothetical protein [uncultured prokaryote]
MHYRPTYDSRDLRYKSPYGAVASGTAVALTLRPGRAEGFSHASVTARFESRKDEIVIVKMPWQGHDLGQDIFFVELDTTGYVGLIWYSFRLERLDGRTQDLGPYQLTVYDGTEEVPGWFGEGVTYQIFPDRFCRSRIPDPEGLVGGRTVHQNWEEPPEFRPNSYGEIRNRDFFGGDFQGVISKLDYLKSLGVETIYFNPIFEAAENHRYGTADYSRVDPMLGTNEDFSRLCDEAHRRGMRVMLDGVFNHTGCCPEAAKLYISARSNVNEGAALRFKGTWMRLTRRAVRDYSFRGMEVARTLDMWANVRRGEKLYISPFKNKADIIFDSSLPYEVPVMKHYALPILQSVPEENERREELLDLVRAFDHFQGVDPQLVARDSLLREFIGGGCYPSH